MSSLKFIELLFPDGRAFASVEESKKFNTVLSLQVDRILGWIQYFQDQIWYANDDFDPEPWEKRYKINVSEFSTIEQRRQVVKSYMVWPQTNNRLSLDYLQKQLDNAGYSDVIISTNENDDIGRYLHGNNISLDENYSIGPDTYNSITLNGTIDASIYFDMLLLLMSIKPLDTAVYDNVDVSFAYAFDDNFALAFDDNFALVINTL